MASRSTKRLEAALASTRKRATDIRKKIKTEQPVVVASTLGGGFLAGWLDKNNPFPDDAKWAKSPELVLGAVGVIYGLTSRRAGQTEKIVTAASTGLLTVYVYKQSLVMGK